MTEALRTGLPFSSFTTTKYSHEVSSLSLSFCANPGTVDPSRVTRTIAPTKNLFMGVILVTRSGTVTSLGRQVFSASAADFVRASSAVKAKASQAPPPSARAGKPMPKARGSLSFTIAEVKTWDVIVIGGGIIGLSLSIALRKRGATVLVVERGEPGREASYAAGGMLVECPLETPRSLQTLAIASARLYPEFAHELQVETGITPDLRDAGTIVFPLPEHVFERPGFTTESMLPAPLAELEPALSIACPALFLTERSIDPRALSS